MAAALLEVLPAPCVRGHYEAHRMICFPYLDVTNYPEREVLMHRAYWLGVMGIVGPNHPITCINHIWTTKNPEFTRWQNCAQVPVRDALRGVTCGAP